MYFAGFVLPLPGNLPLIGFALGSMLAVVTSSRASVPEWVPLMLAVVAFLGAMVVSTVTSVDLNRSLHLSTPFLAAVLLFFVATVHCDGTRDIHWLYLTLSAVGLGLACTLLRAAWHNNDVEGAHALVSRLGISIFVVPNDLTFLALITPLSLVLLFRKPRGVMGITAACSILLSICAIFVYRSRTAALTAIISLVCATLLTQRRRRLATGLAYLLGLLLLVLLFNALLFPESQLIVKTIRKWGTLGRIAYWKTTWAMFLDAPLVGQGPHTYGLFHKTPWAHNLYLEVLAEQGLLGLSALIGMLACGIVGGWKLQHAPAGDTRLLGMGALASLIGLCSAGVVELTLVREWVVTMLFMLLGVISHLVSMQTQQGRTSLRRNGIA
jgi:O-antigen ligase